jgi:hypothetical protein
MSVDVETLVSGEQASNIPLFDLPRTVRIDRQLARIGDGKPVLGPVKDRKNRPRVIPLPDVVLNSLSEHLVRWPASSGDLSFRNERDEPIRRTTFSDIWRKAVEPEL